MRVVLDTNVLISGLLIQSSAPARLIALWRAKRFDLVTALEQLDEITRVTRYPSVRARLPVALAGRLVNDLRNVALLVDPRTPVDRSPDPHDNYLLAIAEACAADYLVTGDKVDLLALVRHRTTPIVTVRAFLDLLEG